MQAWHLNVVPHFQAFLSKKLYRKGDESCKMTMLEKVDVCRSLFLVCSM